ncbi:hypothetical protein ACJ6ID_02940 [Acinetobacter nosocomialis]|uniref:hypothetical protein n=1 Tax=Acinetobacter nosocomialis TaxID=106654 RepID=UPI00396CB40E
MENLIRLLNPKTVNYEAIRVDNTKPLYTAQDVILAISYSQLTRLQENLIRLKCLGANTPENILIFSELLTSKFDQEFSEKGLRVEYRLPVVKTALIEFCMVSGDYQPSTRNRAVFSGYSHTTVKNIMSKHIDDKKEFFDNQYQIAESKIMHQLKKDTL